MTDLHVAIGAALDREQAQHRRCTDCTYEPVCLKCGTCWPCLPWRRVEADRRVLARHEARPFDLCHGCEMLAPCPDLLDLAARYDVDTSR